MTCRDSFGSSCSAKRVASGFSADRKREVIRRGMSSSSLTVGLTARKEPCTQAQQRQGARESGSETFSRLVLVFLRDKACVP